MVWCEQDLSLSWTSLWQEEVNAGFQYKSAIVSTNQLTTEIEKRKRKKKKVLFFWSHIHREIIPYSDSLVNVSKKVLTVGLFRIRIYVCVYYSTWLKVIKRSKIQSMKNQVHEHPLTFSSSPVTRHQKYSMKHGSQLARVWPWKLSKWKSSK